MGLPKDPAEGLDGVRGDYKETVLGRQAARCSNSNGEAP